MKKIVLVNFPVEDYYSDSKDSELVVATKISKRGDIPLFLLPRKNGQWSRKVMETNKAIMYQADIVYVHNRDTDEQVEELIGHAVQIGKIIKLSHRTKVQLQLPRLEKPKAQISMFEEEDNETT